MHNDGLSSAAAHSMLSAHGLIVSGQSKEQMEAPLPGGSETAHFQTLALLGCYLVGLMFPQKSMVGTKGPKLRGGAELW